MIVCLKAAAAALATMAGLTAGCAASRPASSPPVTSSIAPATRPALRVITNDATAEYESGWSPLRLAATANPVTVDLVAPETQPDNEPAPATTQGPSQIGEGRRNSVAGARRGTSNADAIRGKSRVALGRGTAGAAAARGTSTVIALRGTAAASAFRAMTLETAVRDTAAAQALRPHLELSIAADKPQVAPGELLTYLMSIRNDSRVEAREISIADYLPSELELVIVQGAKLVAGGDNEERSIHFKLEEPLAPGKVAQIRVTTRVKD